MASATKYKPGPVPKSPGMLPRLTLEAHQAICCFIKYGTLSEDKRHEERRLALLAAVTRQKGLETRVSLLTAYPVGGGIPGEPAQSIAALTIVKRDVEQAKKNLEAFGPELQSDKKPNVVRRLDDWAKALVATNVPGKPPKSLHRWNALSPASARWWLNNRLKLQPMSFDHASRIYVAALRAPKLFPGWAETVAAHPLLKSIVRSHYGYGIEATPYRRAVPSRYEPLTPVLRPHDCIAKEADTLTDAVVKKDKNGRRLKTRDLIEKRLREAHTDETVLAIIEIQHQAYREFREAFELSGVKIDEQIDDALTLGSARLALALKVKYVSPEAAFLKFESPPSEDN